jgi:hypothetical protein
MTSTQRLISELATVHGVDCETIVRAAMHDFAFGRGKGQQADAIRAIQSIDAAHGDENCHSTSEGKTKNVTATNLL